MKISRAIAYSEAQREVIGIEDAGNRVERLTDYHWRVNGKIDWWPSGKKYQINKGNVRQYEDIKDFICLLSQYPKS